MQLSPGKLQGMKRLSDKNGIFKMTAVDQRPPIKKPIAEFLKTQEAPWVEVAKFKSLLIESLQDSSSALLLDPHFAIPSSMDILDSKKGLVVTLEDSIFSDTKGGRISSSIDNWSVSKIKRMGADAVKVLAYTYIQIGNFERVIEVLKRGYSKRNDQMDFDYFNNMGYALSQIEEFDESIIYLKKASELNLSLIHI